MKKKTFHLVSLGCAKNTVDSNSMAQLMQGDGFSAEENPRDALLSGMVKMLYGRFLV